MEVIEGGGSRKYSAQNCLETWQDSTSHPSHTAPVFTPKKFLVNFYPHLKKKLIEMIGFSTIQD
jgi:hypothetical protein